MSIVVDISNSIDTLVGDYAKNVFEYSSSYMLSLLRYTAIAGLMLMALNHVIQFKAVNYGQYFHWAFRFILLYTFISIWDNFKLIYDALDSLEKGYSLLLIKGALNGSLGIKSYPKIFNVAGITDANQAADEFAHAMNYVSGLYFSYAKKMSIWHFGECIFAAFTGLIILLVGYIFTAIALVIVVFAKIGVAVAMSFAPLALVMLMMEQTRGHFESWVKFLVGFFIIPMLTSSLMSLMVYAAGTSVDAIMTKSGASGTAGGMPDQFIPLVLLTFGALIFLSQIPTMASTLAGASVAAVGTSLASSQSLMNRARSIKGAAGAAASGGKRLRDAAGIGIAARKAGASAPRTAWAMISGMRQSALTRASRRDNRMGDRMPGTSNGGRNGPSTPPAAPEDGNTERNVYKP